VSVSYLERHEKCTNVMYVVSTALRCSALHLRCSVPPRCEVCRSHFMEMYSTCDNGRCDIPKPANVRGQHISLGEPALALWVWRAHNTVNARLALEGDEEVGPYE
ncbi:unnamed protein product, partial [Ectocarpus sp. 4 AP-2014]